MNAEGADTTQREEHSRERQQDLLSLAHDIRRGKLSAGLAHPRKTLRTPKRGCRKVDLLHKDNKKKH
jgi:hypothetical protein